MHSQPHLSLMQGARKPGLTLRTAILGKLPGMNFLTNYSVQWLSDLAEHWNHLGRSTEIAWFHLHSHSLMQLVWGAVWTLGALGFPHELNMQSRLRKICFPVVWLQPSQDYDKRSALAYLRTLRKPRLLSLPAWISTGCSQHFLYPPHNSHH